MPWHTSLVIVSYCAFAVAWDPVTPTVRHHAIFLRVPLIRGGATTGPPLSAGTAIGTASLSSVVRSGGDDDGDRSMEPARSPLRMYLACSAIVLLWAGAGTLFYSWINSWPLPQSFFYAIDAGMSIGFCTDVKETTDVSRAFTIVYVLAFASAIGGALVLFVENVTEGVEAAARGTFVRLVEEDAFRRANTSGSGALCYEEFQFLPALQCAGLAEDEMRRVWKKFDTLRDGVVHLNGEFIGRYNKIDTIIRKATSEKTASSLSPSATSGRIVAFLREKIGFLCRTEHRLCVTFIFWLLLGVVWGMVDQGWTPVTALHFAVSACTTGGLTAPPVGADGILPAGPSLFCGLYCLFGVPLFAVTLGHFARILVEEHVIAAESRAIAQPMSRTEFEFAQKLCTNDSVVHLSDFIIFQLLRQGKIDIKIVQALKKRFRAMDLDSSGVLTLEQATSK